MFSFSEIVLFQFCFSVFTCETKRWNKTKVGVAYLSIKKLAEWMNEWITNSLSVYDPLPPPVAIPRLRRTRSRGWSILPALRTMGTRHWQARQCRRLGRRTDTSDPGHLSRHFGTCLTDISALDSLSTYIEDQSHCILCKGPSVNIRDATSRLSQI